MPPWREYKVQFHMRRETNYIPCDRKWWEKVLNCRRRSDKCAYTENWSVKYSKNISGDEIYNANIYLKNGRNM